jgi:hypothetical protein
VTQTPPHKPTENRGRRTNRKSGCKGMKESRLPHFTRRDRARNPHKQCTRSFLFLSIIRTPRLPPHFLQPLVALMDYFFLLSGWSFGLSGIPLLEGRKQEEKTKQKKREEGGEVRRCNTKLSPPLFRSTKIKTRMSTGAKVGEGRYSKRKAQRTTRTRETTAAKERGGRDASVQTEKKKMAGKQRENN